MIAIQRPGQPPLEAYFLLIAFEGTLATDRRVHPKAKDKINLLSKRLKIYVLTTSERDAMEEALRRVKAEVVFIPEGGASEAKLGLLRQLGRERAVALGSGLSDVPMLEEAALGICVLNREGAVAEAITKADLVVMNILDALDFLLKPLRQKATCSK